MSGEILFTEALSGGGTWSHILKRGTALRIEDIVGGANVGAIFYNADCPVERLNIPDTLKAQHIARITRHAVLYSDMGRILCSVTEDSLGWHDALCGCHNAQSIRTKYGIAPYQTHRNGFYKNAHDSFLIELQKYGLGPRDLSPNINFFSKTAFSSDGSFKFVEGYSQPGSIVELRAEMNVLVILSSVPHPLDPTPSYAPKPVHLTIKRVGQPEASDPCRRSAPENDRGFTLTERYFL